MAEHSGPIDFAALAYALLQNAESLCAEWLPGGKKQGYNWMCGGLDGSAGSRLGVNLNTGKWGEFAEDVYGGDFTSLYAAIHGISQAEAARSLIDRYGWLKTLVVQAPVPAPATSTKRKTMWKPVVPVPPHAKPCDFWHYEYKNVEGTWRYEFEGVFYGHVARFRTSDGGKEVLPYTWCVDESDERGTSRWHQKQWEAPRPLYVPRGRLSPDPTLTAVVLVEGEKCTDAGHGLLRHEYDFVSWPGGGHAWDKAAWGWIMGRTVIMWPDADTKRERLSVAEKAAGVDPATKPLLPEHKQPGMKAMAAIGAHLVAEMGCTVTICPIPKPDENATDGWDIADAIASGWDAEQVRAFLRGARAFVPAAELAQPTAGKPAPASAGAGGGGRGDEPDTRWTTNLIRSEKGAIKPVRENAVMVLDGWPERGIPGVAEAAGVIAFNLFTNNVEKTCETPWGTPAGVWLESDELLMGQWMVREHWLPSMARTTLEEAVLMVAQRHCFHPVRDRFVARRGKWDKVPRLKTWLARCVLEENEYDHRDPLQRYLARVGKWFIMGMVARVLPTEKDGARVVRGPGTKFDTMLILEGPQSWGKSSLAAVLGGEHFADTGLMIGDKDSYQNIQGVLVYEWGELENLTRQEVGKVKLFISSPKDRFRASFDKRPRDYPRQVVFVGTTNESTYLTDVTGNRRFWPVRITRPPDLDWLKANLDQLIAEALECLDAGERFWPTHEEQRLLFDPQQQARTVESSLEAEIRHLLYDENQKVPFEKSNVALLEEIGMTELLTRVGYTIEKQTDVIVKKASALLHSLGWTVRRSSVGSRPRLYVRPSGNADLTAGASDSSTRPLQGDANTRAADDCPF